MRHLMSNLSHKKNFLESPMVRYRTNQTSQSIGRVIQIIYYLTVIRVEKQIFSSYQWYAI